VVATIEVVGCKMDESKAVCCWLMLFILVTNLLSNNQSGHLLFIL